MSGFARCKWCGGHGCIACEAEQKKYEAQRMQPIFTARVGDEGDMTLMKQFLGRDALEKAFGPDGGGMQEVEVNAAIAGVIQAMRKSAAAPSEESDPR